MLPPNIRRHRKLTKVKISMAHACENVGEINAAGMKLIMKNRFEPLMAKQEVKSR